MAWGLTRILKWHDNGDDAEAFQSFTSVCPIILYNSSTCTASMTLFVTRIETFLLQWCFLRRYLECSYWEIWQFWSMRSEIQHRKPIVCFGSRPLLRMQWIILQHARGGPYRQRGRLIKIHAAFRDWAATRSVTRLLCMCVHTSSRIRRKIHLQLLLPPYLTFWEKQVGGLERSWGFPGMRGRYLQRRWSTGTAILSTEVHRSPKENERCRTRRQKDDFMVEHKISS